MDMLILAGSDNVILYVTFISLFMSFFPIKGQSRNVDSALSTRVIKVQNLGLDLQASFFLSLSLKVSKFSSRSI